MPARPRTWPSIRFSLFSSDALISLRMRLIYPHRVYYSSEMLCVEMTVHRHGDDHGLHATDPVCGMSVDPQSAKHRFTYQGHDYLFCSGQCRERFAAEPEKFLRAKQTEPAAPAGAIYTCPMHPEGKRSEER